VAFAAAAFLAVVPLSATQQKPTFSSKVEVVRVDVLVTEDNRPIRTLRPADFEVRDNGVVQQIDLASFEQVPLNVVLALDASDSVTGERLDHLRAAGLGLLDGLVAQDRAALVTFNHVLSLGSPLTGSLDAVRQAARRITPGGGTALYDAAYAGLVLGESDAGRTLLLLFTDGTDTASYLARETVLDIAKRTEVVVYAVAAGTPTAFEKDIVKQTGGGLIRVETTSGLPKVFASILQEFRERYLLSFSPRGVAAHGWHQIEVRVKGRRALVKARAGYQR
jgi:VWFA-related protein